MHKGVILLVKAETEQDAKEKATNFMDRYQDTVWDWYVIGGRWSGILNDLATKFSNKADKILKKEKHGFITQKEVTDKQPELQKLWEDLGGSGTNPLGRSTYDSEGATDDVMPLKDCLETVLDWVQDPELESDKVLAELETEYPKEGDAKNFMRGYLLKKAGSLLEEDFFFDTNVYNVEDWNYSIPDDIDGWFAVVIDMHN